MALAYTCAYIHFCFISLFHFPVCVVCSHPLYPHIYRSNHHLNPLYVKPTDLDDVDKGAITPNGKSAPSISTGGEGGGEGEGAVEPDSNGSE